MSIRTTDFDLRIKNDDGLSETEIIIQDSTIHEGGLFIAVPRWDKEVPGVWLTADEKSELIEYLTGTPKDEPKVEIPTEIGTRVRCYYRGGGKRFDIILSDTGEWVIYSVGEVVYPMLIGQPVSTFEIDWRDNPFEVLA